MAKVMGTFNGDADTVYVGIGFIPDIVQVYNMESTANNYSALWMRDMVRDLTEVQSEGYIETLGVPAQTAAAAGIKIYRGGQGVPIATATHHYIIKNASPDYRYSTTYGQIKTWTLGNATNRTGNWNLEADTTYVAIGSEVVIDGVSYWMTAITSNGEQANEVTLNIAAPSGRIDFIGRQHTYIDCPVGMVMPPGFSIVNNVVNTAGDTCLFIASTLN